MIHGERQMAQAMENIRPDHRARYILASSYIHNGDKVLDAICGIGYGSKLMSQLSSASFMAFDRDKEAIGMAKRYYSSPNINFLRADYNEVGSIYPPESFDLITCFEAIEHVEDEVGLLNTLGNLLKNAGILIISTPNEKRLPWSKEAFPEHICHFRPLEFEVMLEQAGFKIEFWHNQKDKYSFSIGHGYDGNFMIAVCRKI